MKHSILCLLLILPANHAGEPGIPNELIDYKRHLQIAMNVQPVREQRRLTEEQFFSGHNYQSLLPLLSNPIYPSNLTAFLDPVASSSCWLGSCLIFNVV